MLPHETLTSCYMLLLLLIHPQEAMLFCYRRQAMQLYVYVLLLNLVNGDATPSNLTTRRYFCPD